MDDFDDDFDEGVYYDDDYVYVDDSFDLADELAENVIPDPPLIDRKEEDWDEFDSYDYWMDIEYNTDEYYDTLLEQTGGETHLRAGQKRRRAVGVQAEGRSPKRRKDAAARAKHADTPGLCEITPVLWLSFAETHPLSDVLKPYDTKPSAPYALFSDWQQRFKKASGFRVAIEAHGDDVADTDEGFEEGVGDEEEDGDDDNEGELRLDPQQLMAILQHKLSSSGMDAAQQAKFTETIMSSLSKGGGEGLDEMLAELTDCILDQATDGGPESGAARWLSQQGVTFGEDAEDQGVDPRSADGTTSEPGPGIPDQNGRDHSSRADEEVLKDVAAFSTEVTRNGRSGSASGTRASTISANGPDGPTSKEPLAHAEPSRSKGEKSAAATRAAAKTPKSSTATARTSEGSKATAKTTKGSTATTSRKRKAEAGNESESEARPKRAAPSFAAPTASSSHKNADVAKRATRSSRQSKK